eukprot:992854-Amphidinium_carterae.1
MTSKFPIVNNLHCLGVLPWVQVVDSKGLATEGTMGVHQLHGTMEGVPNSMHTLDVRMSVPAEDGLGCFVG